MAVAAPQRCIICGESARNTLGIRLRYGRQRDAHWAPDLDAYLCDRHAKSGCVIGVEIAATGDGRVRTTTTGPRGSSQVVLVIDSGGRKEPPGQERLL